MAEPWIMGWGEASTLTGIPVRRLRDWAKAGIVAPQLGAEHRSPDDPPGRFYVFPEVVGLRALALLRERRVPLHELRKVQPWLIRHAPPPWERLRIGVSDERRLCLDGGDGECDARTAPFCLELGGIAAELRTALAELRRRRPEDVGRVTRDRRIRGGEWILAGTRIPTWSVMQMHEEGYDRAAIFQQFPQITEADVLAAIEHEQRQGWKGFA